MPTESSSHGTPGVFTLIEDDPPAGALPKAGTVCQENGKPFPAS
jgi:hypothetical protein